MPIHPISARKVVADALLWAQRTPDKFVFHIKVYGALTGHSVDPRSLPPDIRNELPEKDKKEKNVFIREPSLLISGTVETRH